MERARADEAVNDAAGPGTGHLSLSVLITYAPPIMGLSAMMLYVQVFFVKFATDVLLLGPVAVSALFAASRIWDAVADPLIGYMSDRTKSRMGRRRPWMLAGAPLMGLSFFMLWSPPESLSDTGLLVWSAGTLALFFTALTFYLVPHQSLGAELSDDYHKRTLIFGVRQVFFLLGMATAMGFMYFATADTENLRESNRNVTLILAIAASVIMLIPPLLLRERDDYQGRGASSPWRALRNVVVENPYARTLLLVWFIDSCAIGHLSVLAPYLAEYALGRPDLQAVLPALFMVASMAAVPLWMILSRKIGKRDAWLVAMLAAALAFGSIVFTGPGDVTFTIIAMIIAGAGYGCGGALGPALLADVIDYDEYRTGERKEGAYSAAWGFAVKTALGVMIFVAGLILELSGFEANIEQSERTLTILRASFGGLPFVLFLIGIFLFRNFGLDRGEHARIRAEIESRR